MNVSYSNKSSVFCDSGSNASYITHPHRAVERIRAKKVKKTLAWCHNHGQWRKPTKPGNMSLQSTQAQENHNSVWYGTDNWSSEQVGSQSMATLFPDYDPDSFIAKKVRIYRCATWLWLSSSKARRGEVCWKFKHYEWLSWNLFTKSPCWSGRRK